MCLVTPERAYYGQFCFCCCRSFDNVKLYIKQRAGPGRAAPVKMLVCWTIAPRPARRPQPRSSSVSQSCYVVTGTVISDCSDTTMTTTSCGLIKDENGLILPRKIANPCVESPFKRDLHREIKWNSDKWVIPGSTLAHMCLCYIRWCMFIWRLSSLEIDGETRLPNV